MIYVVFKRTMLVHSMFLCEFVNTTVLQIIKTQERIRFKSIIRSYLLMSVDNEGLR